MNVTINSHIPQVMDAVERASRNGLMACGFTAEAHAKEYETAVDTGRLRNSITHAEDDKKMVVGTNVFYAPYIEFGTRGGAGLHYLKRSIADHTEEYKDLLQQAFNSIE